jgi:hypothetical protein
MSAPSASTSPLPGASPSEGCCDPERFRCRAPR